MTISRPASAALGMSCTKLLNSEANNSTQMPCRIAEARVLAPAATLVELRTITPVIGRPPRKPDITLALP
ncbi:Uncharacterised protein [Mycobacteroides abscessus subsp. abscessus]|nr:Uncharacterised protein [Mycobacteroides abscessus subsp. abscessus]SKP13634.1 Uncharacterised protein [Mycobacteroides abscessus subsp. massiliense]SHU36344.1 Uncharacterised protein [Mycobacteroides abscessus subsp. abscessus]SIL37292.1 Uncharacterised protein [Mycobacteroides abscessus subsp. abscessus]SKY48437.1 Uncharacterised protein [Mycobacteroides abscessus subsp. abscessus]